MKSRKNIRINTDVLALHPLVTPEGRGGYITLDLNEGYGTLPASILRKIASIDASQVSRYPEYKLLIAMIAKDLRVATENIFITNGSDDAIKMLIDILFAKGETVTLPVPTFFIYNHFLKLRAVNIDETPYLLERGKFAFPTKDVLRSIKSGSRGVIVCNPGNPIGIPIEKKDLFAIARETHKHNIPFIVDEAYVEYSDTTLVPLIMRYPNVIVLRTFSKAYGLAGLRVGYAVATEEVTGALQKLRLPWSVNHVAVEAAKVVLREKKTILKDVKRQKARLKDLHTILRKKRVPVYLTATNFLLARVGDAKHVVALLKGKHVLVKDLTGYPAEHGLLSNVLRITVPSHKDHKDVCDILTQQL